MILDAVPKLFSVMARHMSRLWRGQSIVLTRHGAWLLFVMMALYCVIGFTGFDPARQDEAYIFDIVLECYRGQSSWLIPQLAGRPFMEKPPLYYLLASLCTRMFSPWLSLHDAARLCSAFLIAVSTLCIGYAGRLTWGCGYGRFAALALLSSVGLFVPAHMMLTDNAQLTGCALGLLGLAAHVEKKWWSGLALGSGAGFAFLSKGLLGPGALGLAALSLPLWPYWRTRRYLGTLAVAFVVVLPWLLIWPFDLYRKSPDLFFQWLSQNNFERFAGTAPVYLNAVKEKNFWYTKFLWGTFPTLPLAIVTIKRYRSTLSERPAFQIGLAFAAVLILVLASSATLRAIYALPLLLAFALIAAPALRTPPPWFKLSANAFRYVFVVGALLIWSYWLIAVVFKTNPLHMAVTMALSMPSPRDSVWTIIVAVAVTTLWFVCQRAWGEQQWRRSADWYSSIFTLVALFSLLCFPAISTRESYRQVFDQMGGYLPPRGCVSSIGLGESQQGMLDYVLNVQTQMILNAHDARCGTLLIDTSANAPIPDFGGAWHLLWQGMRSTHDHEVFYLLARADRSRLQNVSIRQTALKIKKGA